MIQGPLRPGDRVGDRLVVIEQLGYGAKGIVYKAHDTRLDRTIALKLLLELAEPDAHDRAHKRLVKEAQAMAKLSHPNVVTIHDVGTMSMDEQVRVYLEMEYVRGPSLEQQMEQWSADTPHRGAQRWREIVAVFIQAGEGLAAAHDLQLVHRDFKPANVLLEPSGRAMVTDFGLVRLEDDQEENVARVAEQEGTTSSALGVSLTQTGAMIGTPAYMAPEQLEGGTVDARADQFAFCVALYEALYGQRPFEGDDLAQLTRSVLQDEPRPAPASAPPVPRFVERVIRRGLSRHLDERYPSMHALLEELRYDPRTRWRRALATLGLVIGAVALIFGIRWYVEPGTLILDISGSRGEPTEIKVTIDDELYEYDPESGPIQLAAGLHEVTVKAPNYEPEKKRLIDIPRGESTLEEVILRRPTGALDLDIHPRDTSVFLDESPNDSSFDDLDIGPHTLHVSLPDHHMALLKFEIEDGERVDMSAYLAPAVVFDKRGGGLPMGRGVLGDVDGDGAVDIWDHDYADLSAYSPMTGRTLWGTKVSLNSHAQFLTMVDLDEDGVQDPVIAGVDQTGAVLRALDGRQGGGAPRWVASLDPSLQTLAPLVPPVVIDAGAPIVIATSLERGALTAYDGRDGNVRWQAPIEGMGFGLVAGRDPVGPWVAVAHTGGVTAFEAATKNPEGERRWHEPIDGFGPALIQQLQVDDHLMNHGRSQARPWMVALPFDEIPGDDLLLTQFADSTGGPLLALSGRKGEELLRGPRIEGWSLRADVDAPAGECAQAYANVLVPTKRTVIIDGCTHQMLPKEAGERIGRWPCSGPTHLFGVDKEKRVYVRALGSSARQYPFSGLDDFVDVNCADWDGDGDDETLILTDHSGLRIYDEATEVGAVAVSRRTDVVVPAGDIDGDARPDFVLGGGGVSVILGSRIRWARRFSSALRVAPVVADFNHDGSLDVAVFNGFQEQSSLEVFAAIDGHRVGTVLDDSGEPFQGFSLATPTIVPGLHSNTSDLVFPGPSGTVVRVLGHDFSARQLVIDPPLETYAGIGASKDGRTLWMTHWKKGPHVRVLQAPEGEWHEGSQTLADTPRPWTTTLSIEGTFGGWPKPRQGNLDEDDALEVAITIDHGRLLILDAESGDCAWSRWMKRGVRDGPTLFDLDGDLRDEVLAIAAADAPAWARPCAQPDMLPAPEEAPDLLALEGSDGALRWRLPDAGSSSTPPIGLNVDGRRLVLGGSKRLGLFAADADGDLAWTVPLDDPITTPLSSGDLNGDGRLEVAFGTHDGRLCVHDVATGVRRWCWLPPETNEQPEAQRAAPLIVDLDQDGSADEVLLASSNGVLFALDGQFSVDRP